MRIETRALLLLGSLAGLPQNDCFPLTSGIVSSRLPCLAAAGTFSPSSSPSPRLGCGATSSGLPTEDPLWPRPCCQSRRRLCSSVSLARCSIGPVDAGLSLRRGLESLLGAGVVSHLLSVSSSPPYAVSDPDNSKTRYARKTRFPSCPLDRILPNVTAIFPYSRYGAELLRSPISDALSIPINAGLESAQKELALLLMKDSRLELICSLAQGAPPLPHRSL